MLLFFRPSRVLCALLILILTLGLCACTGTGFSGAASPTEEPAETPRPVFSGSWTAYLDIGDEVMAALGFDLTSELPAPLLAEYRLDVRADGACTLTRNDAACAAVLRPVLADFVRRLQAEESAEELGGLALAEALGADPNEIAAALCDELFAPPLVKSGRYDDGQKAVTWDDGSVSPLAFEGSAGNFRLDGLYYAPAD